MHDLILEGGRVVDGSGAPAIRADVAIKGDRISQIGDLKRVSAARRIDVSECMIAPGFIDTHSHADISVIASPEARAKIGQGVTTEIVGNCGFSAAPVTDATRDVARHFSQPVLGNSDIEWNWTGVAGYFAAIERSRPAVNVAALVGHGSLRTAVMGFDKRVPAAAELVAMQTLLLEAMDQGTFGISSGLCYPPGAFADTDEIVALCQAVASKHGIYATHLRDQADHLEQSLTEALDIGRRAGIPILVSHHKAAGRRNWGKVERTLAMLDEARSAGQQAWSDVYPYVTGQSTIISLLPPWAVEGGLDAMLGRLTNESLRHRLREEFKTGSPGWENRAAAVGWDNIIVTSVSTERNRDIVGVSVQDAAVRRGKSAVDFLLDLIVEERGLVGKQNTQCSEDDVQRVLVNGHTMIGSDGMDVPHPHPRQYGCFARVLGEYVRERAALSLEAAVHKMTGLPASVFGFRDIGLVREGLRADLVVFNRKTVRERGTFVDPCHHPDGIEWVLVGGVAALAEKRFTGERNGMLIRKLRRSS